MSERAPGTTNAKPRRVGGRGGSGMSGENAASAKAKHRAVHQNPEKALCRPLATRYLLCPVWS